MGIEQSKEVPYNEDPRKIVSFLIENDERAKEIFGGEDFMDSFELEENSIFTVVLRFIHEYKENRSFSETLYKILSGQKSLMEKIISEENDAYKKSVLEKLYEYIKVLREDLERFIRFKEEFSEIYRLQKENADKKGVDDTYDAKYPISLLDLENEGLSFNPNNLTITCFNLYKEIKRLEELGEELGFDDLVTIDELLMELRQERDKALHESQDKRERVKYETLERFYNHVVNRMYPELQYKCIRNSRKKT